MRAQSVTSRAERGRTIYRANVLAASGTQVADADMQRLPGGRLMTEPCTTRTHFQISDAVRASISGDGLVLLDIHGGVVLASNTIGARIWQLVEARLDCLEIASRLACDYDVSIERAQHDVAAFLAALETRGLVSAEPAC
jgi:hypothetical protein